MSLVAAVPSVTGTAGVTRIPARVRTIAAEMAERPRDQKTRHREKAQGLHKVFVHEDDRVERGHAMGSVTGAATAVFHKIGAAQ
ncbi:hypothetical protein ATI53_100218 [Salipiger aestuarii]|uniref:Uncharacterized protein n=1 Tax=Salipiger aestuarii TaxID=568098 RepID=A0A327YQQ3_9RHOB|nr:hypothetical protein ATI53_100218 [Salipiger aestuarii]